MRKAVCWLVRQAVGGSRPVCWCSMRPSPLCPALLSSPHRPLACAPPSLPGCSMSIASALLLAGAAAYFVGAMVAATAVDYREIAAAADGADPSSMGGGGSGSRGALLAEARAAIVGGEADEEEAGGRPGRLRTLSGSSRGDEEAEAGVSPDRSLLPSDAQRSS